MSIPVRSLSVVIPTYNEVEIVRTMVSSLLAELSVYEFEIIVIDDNSNDGTQDILEELKNNHSELVVVQRDSDRSLGKSIGAGIERASKNYICIMDADLTHNPSYIHEMLNLADDRCYVVGSRFCRGGSMPSKFHFYSSKYFNKFLRLYLQTGLSDNLSGFILFKTDNYRPPLDGEVFFGYGDFFFRLIHHLNSLGYLPLEFPIVYRNRSAGRSKSNFFKLFFKYSWAAFSHPFLQRKLRDNFNTR